jgi:hypothetical protein
VVVSTLVTGGSLHVVWLLRISKRFDVYYVKGLAWAKFSIPKASTIAYSDYLLLTAFHSHRAIMFRAANSRTYGSIIEGSFRYVSSQLME